jgi:predicted amidohydrolase
MSQNLTVAAVSLNIAWSDRSENLIRVHSLLGTIDSSTDLVVLPELFSTGFIQDAPALEQLAETTDDMTISAVKMWAREFNVAIAGSFLCRQADSYYNRGFIIEPNGEATFYDKRHLFSLSSECTVYESGCEIPPVVRFRGWNISLVICYDLRFPVWCRNDAQRYDVMLVPANWPTARQYAWRQLLIARGIENQAYYVGVNRSGEDDYGNYDNTSLIVDAMGKPMAESKSREDIIYAHLDRDTLNRQRTKLPFGKDADAFTCAL